MSWHQNASKIWTLSSRSQSRIQPLEMRTLKTIFNKTRRDKIRIVVMREVVEVLFEN